MQLFVWRELNIFSRLYHKRSCFHQCGTQPCVDGWVCLPLLAGQPSLPALTYPSVPTSHTTFPHPFLPPPSLPPPLPSPLPPSGLRTHYLSAVEHISPDLYITLELEFRAITEWAVRHLRGCVWESEMALAQLNNCRTPDGGFATLKMHVHVQGYKLPLERNFVF